MKNLPKEILFNLIKSNPVKIIEYLVKKNISLDWKSLYYFLFHAPKTEFEYAFPINHEDTWLNAIINRTTNKIPENFKIIKGGKLLACGSNAYGQLGLGNNDNRNKFELVPNVKNVVNVFCGNGRTIILLRNGTIMSCGYNYYGQLGLGYFKNRNKFKLVKNVKDVVNVFCGYSHTLLLLKNGTIMSCGDNEYEQLGLGDSSEAKRNRDKFELVPNIKNVVNIFCGKHNTIILLKNGTIMSCGYNKFGQLGFSDNYNRNKFELVPNAKDVVNVFCGYSHTFILLKNETIMSCGNNYDGQLGLGDLSGANKGEAKQNRNKFELVPNVKDVVNVFCGIYNTIILLKNGTIMSCGNNENGQLGLSDKDEFLENRNKFELVPNLKNIVNVSLINNSTIILLKTGQVMKTNKKGFFEKIY